MTLYYIGIFIIMSLIISLTCVTLYFGERDLERLCSNRGNDGKKSRPVKNYNYLLRESGITSVKDHLQLLCEMFDDYYPGSSSCIKLSLVSHSDSKVPINSEISVWSSHPDITKERNIGSKYIVGKNTDLYSIVRYGYNFFFVTDLKKYIALNEFRSESDDFTYLYKTDIVFPIMYSFDDGDYIIGFLSITSARVMNNVKINREIMKTLQLSANLLCGYLLEHLDSPETIIVNRRGYNDDDLDENKENSKIS